MYTQIQPPTSLKTFNPSTVTPIINRPTIRAPRIWLIIPFMSLTIRHCSPHKLMKVMVRTFLHPDFTIAQDTIILSNIFCIVSHCLLIVDVSESKDEFQRVWVIVFVQDCVVVEFVYDVECVAMFMEIV